MLFGVIVIMVSGNSQRKIIPVLEEPLDISGNHIYVVLSGTTFNNSYAKSNEEFNYTRYIPLDVQTCKKEIRSSKKADAESGSSGYSYNFLNDIVKQNKADIDYSVLVKQAVIVQGKFEEMEKIIKKHKEE